MSFFHYHGSLFRKIGVSPSSFTSGHTYAASRFMWVYTPPGYADNANNYPLILSMGGDGSRSAIQSDVVKGTNDVSNEGVGYFLLNGDKPPNAIIACVQIPSGDYTATDFDNVKTTMVANYRINTNRISVIGFSRGGFGVRVWCQNRASSICSAVSISAGAGTSWNWSGSSFVSNGQSDIAHFFVHGTVDGTVTNGEITTLTSVNASTFNRDIPLNTMALWNKDHEAYVWNTMVHNRKERTNATGTALFDYVRYLTKYSKDQTERCTLLTSNAEATLDITDWREARLQVESMTGATKSSLLTRLATLKTTIDAGGRRWTIDHGVAATVTTGETWNYINDMTTHTSSAVISNLVTDDNGASTIGYTITAQHATTGRENSIASSRGRGRYFGHPTSFNTDGMTIVAATTGTSKFTGLNNAKLYDLKIFASVASNFTTNSTIVARVAGTSKTMYTECNNSQYIQFTNLTPSSGEIIINMYSQEKNTFCQGLELYEHP